MSKKQPVRAQILDTAKSLTLGDRNKAYGEPKDNLTIFAGLVSEYLSAEYPGIKLDAVDAAMIMVLAKVSRVTANKGHVDNFVDGAAYFAIAGECVE